MKSLAFAVALALSGIAPARAQQASHAPHQLAPYAGQQARTVTTLSPEDIADLQAGRGWGLAKPAELNGFPGPMHVLELDEELALTPVQKSKVQAIFDRMKRRAIALAPAYIEAEAELDRSFRSGGINANRLKAHLRAAERARADLRAVHLEAHLATTPILTPDQRKRYAELRGYGADGHTRHGKH